MLMAMVQVVLNGKIQPLPKVTIMDRLFSNLVRVISSRGSTTLPNLVQIVSAVTPPRGGEISGSRAFYYFFVFFFPSHAHSPNPYA